MTIWKVLPVELNEKRRQIDKEATVFQMRHKYLKAVEKYKEALLIFPEPKELWLEYKVVLKNMQENYWLNAKFNEGKKGGYAEALECWKIIMQIPLHIGDDSCHFRIGQIRYELGQFDKAKDELMRAFLISGMARFNRNDKKYFELIQPIVEGKETKVIYTADVETYQFD
jgi:tetratricopeptide (TPR) repeat protein